MIAMRVNQLVLGHYVHIDHGMVAVDYGNDDHLFFERKRTSMNNEKVLFRKS